MTVEPTNVSFLDRLRAWEHALAGLAIVVSVLGFVTAALQTYWLRKQVSEEESHNRTSEVFEYLTTIYDRRICDVVTDRTAYCSLDDMRPAEKCEKRCWPVKETRLRQAAALALLSLAADKKAKLLMGGGG